MNLTNITELGTYKLRVEIVTIFPPSWRETIKEFQKDNWQNKRLLRNMYKYDYDIYRYMKENNIIPGTIVNEIENQEQTNEFWQYLNKERSFDNGTK